MVVVCQPYAPAAFTPRKYSRYSFLLEDASTPGPQCDRKDFMSMKNPMTLAGIEPATFRFVAQHLNHCATAVNNLYFFKNDTPFAVCGTPYTCDVLKASTASKISYVSTIPQTMNSVQCNNLLINNLYSRPVQPLMRWRELQQNSFCMRAIWSSIHRMKSG